jgi:hypothetical protein
MQPSSCPRNARKENRGNAIEVGTNWESHELSLVYQIIVHQWDFRMTELLAHSLFTPHLCTVKFVQQPEQRIWLFIGHRNPVQVKTNQGTACYKILYFVLIAVILYQSK